MEKKEFLIDQLQSLLLKQDRDEKKIFIPQGYGGKLPLQLKRHAENDNEGFFFPIKLISLKEELCYCCNDQNILLKYLYYLYIKDFL